MLVEGILQKTLGLKSHRLKRVRWEEEGLVAEADLVLPLEVSPSVKILLEIPKKKV
jgi:hypothetical protein